MQLSIIENVLKPHDVLVIETDDVCKTLADRYHRFPETAVIYYREVAQSHDVTPHCEEDIKFLQSLRDGPFYVIVYPQEVTTIFYIVAFIVLAAVAIALRPQLPNSTQRNTDTGSSNNALSGRANKPRINARIPDIFGTVRSVPDMLAPPYSVFENHIEIEHCYMCIGRGKYTFPNVDGVASIRDGDTLVSKIDGSSAEIYGPSISPNSGDTAQLTIGDAINELVVTAYRSKAVNGQVLVAPNEVDMSETYNNRVQFVYPNRVEGRSGTPKDFTDIFTAGDTIVISTSDVLAGTNVPASPIPNGSYDGTFSDTGVITFFSLSLAGDPGAFIQITATIDGNDYSGKYKISGYTSNTITLADPELSAPGWDALTGTSSVGTITLLTPDFIYMNFSGTYEIDTCTSSLIELVAPNNSRINGNWIWMQGFDIGGGDDSYGFDGATVTMGKGATSGTGGWVGPFVTDTPSSNEIISNFIAQQGAWKDDGTTQIASNVELLVGVTPCDAAGSALGPESYYSVTVEGSDTVKSQRAATLRQLVTTPGRQSVRAKRISPKDTAYTGQVSDEIRWRDLYAVSPVALTDFGDVTTIQTKTSATQAAVAISERQINCLVTRELPEYTGGTSFGSLTPTKVAADIISYICLDPTLGGRTVDEVDFSGIYATMDEITDYFGVDTTKEFCYTFDKENVSFEEMLSIIADAVFCTVYRQGSQIKLFFEKATSDSIMLFNHRNKIPKSEKRTVNFGADYDGINYNYVDPTDDAQVTFYVPEDRSAVVPQTVDSIGIRTTEQAYLHAYRLYAKLRHQNVAVEFDATAEADLVAVNQRILIADNTRPNILDGYVVAQSSLILTLSQPADVSAGGFVIFLQYPSGLVESIGVTQGVDLYHVVLDTAPAETLSIGDDQVSSATYWIVSGTDGRRKAYLLKEKTYPDNFSVKITAINYDDRYYEHDQDFLPPPAGPTEWHPTSSSSYRPWVYGDTYIAALGGGAYATRFPDPAESNSGYAFTSVGGDPLDIDCSSAYGCVGAGYDISFDDSFIFEIKIGAAPPTAIGLVYTGFGPSYNKDTPVQSQVGPVAYWHLGSGVLQYYGGTVSGLPSVAVGDVIGFVRDTVTSMVKVYKNGSLVGSGGDGGSTARPVISRG